LKKKVLIVVILIVVVGLIFYISMKKSNNKRLDVYVHKADKGNLISEVSASGIIEPKLKVNISSNVIGQIVSLTVKEGQDVKKGDFLLQVDPQRYKAEVNSWAAQVRVAKINVEQAEVTLKESESNLNRIRSLYEQQIASESELEQATIKYESAQVQLKSAKEQVRQNEANLERAKDELAKTTFNAPMTGVVSKLNAEEGENVITGTMNNPGTIIMIISDMSEVLAKVNVDETDINQVKIGQKCEITVDAVENKVYKGKVSDIASSASKDQEVSVFEVEIMISNPDENLKPGMSARADIETNYRKNIITIPLQAVVEREIDEKESKTNRQGEGISISVSSSNEKQEVVFIIKDGKAVQVPVKTGISSTSDIEVLSGIQKGDSVITGPYRTLKKLKDGDEVKIKEEKKEEEETDIEEN
jgi:HlyD family secretion protein